MKGVPRLGDDIKIEEVLQKDDLKLAVLSAFQVEPEWVESKLDPKTKVIWVLQAKTAAEVRGCSTLSLLSKLAPCQLVCDQVQRPFQRSIDWNVAGHIGFL